MNVKTEVKERPIIFGTEMVRAILDGRKTQTRRVIKPQPCRQRVVKTNHPRQMPTYTDDNWIRLKDGSVAEIGALAGLRTCPYGQAGDRLWVREAVWESDCGKYLCYLGQVTGNIISETIKYTRDEHSPFQVFGFSVLSHSSPSKKGYAFKRWFGEVDLNKDPWVDMDFTLNTIEAQFHKKKPSIHMPRWASRIDVENAIAPYPQRLQEISEEDAEAEGFTYHIDEFQPGASYLVSAREKFAQYWDSLNGKRYPWSSNPWVWVISFNLWCPKDK